MYKVVVILKDQGIFPDFAEAFVAFFKATREVVENGVSKHALLEASWIVPCKDGQDNGLPLLIPSLATIGHTLGWLDDGKLIEPLPTKTEAEIQDAILEEMPVVFAESRERISEILRALGAVVQ